MKAIEAVTAVKQAIPEDLKFGTYVNITCALGVGLIVFGILESDLAYRNGYTI